MGVVVVVFLGQFLCDALVECGLSHQVLVEDTGCGIPLDKQPAIFSRFEKLHEGIQGSGIGVSLCRFIVEHLKGKIWIDPKYTSGARFVFTHPLENDSHENE